MSILLLEIENWILEVKNYGDGFQVALIEGNQPAVTHFVRLDKDQSETLRDFLIEAVVVSSTHHQDAAK